MNGKRVCVCVCVCVGGGRLAAGLYKHVFRCVLCFTCGGTQKKICATSCKKEQNGVVPSAACGFIYCSNRIDLLIHHLKCWSD